MKVAHPARAIPVDLNPYVEGVWRYRNLSGAWCSEITPADEGTNLVVQTSVSRAPVLYLCGPEPMHRRLEAPPDAHCIGIRLRAGTTAALFGVEGSEVAGGIVHVDDLFPRDHRSLLGALGDARPLLSVVLDLIRARARSARRSPALDRVHLAIRLLSRPQPLGLDAVVQALATSPRSFRREFGQLVGLGPKRFSRVVRLRRAARRLCSASSLATLALESGFSDQSHMTREFVALIGVAPHALRESPLPFVPGAPGSVID